MTTGYVVSGRGDLDGLFLARTSTAASNVNFKSNGGVDLSQRFEPRGATTAIANTGFKSGSTDLAQIFKDITLASIATSLNMTAGNFVETTPARTNTGYATTGLVTGSSGFGSVSASTVGANTLAGLFWNDDDVLKVAFSAGSAPADADTTWQRVDANGVFQGGFTGTRSVSRTAGTSAVSGTRRVWTFNPGVMAFASGQIYAVTFYRL